MASAPCGLSGLIVHEGTEAGLPLQAVQTGRTGCFLLQREALVTAVLLRMAGLEVFDRDAETATQTKSRDKSERTAREQAAVVEHPLEGCPGEVFAGIDFRLRTGAGSVRRGR